MKASVFVGTSLDGYLARSDDTFDFLFAGGGQPHGFDEFMATVDALVMGRNTFDTVLPMAPWPYGTKPVFVLSTRPLPEMPAALAVERLSGEPADVVAMLAGRGIQHIYVDGGVTIQRFLRAGLIDQITVTTVPVLIGAGIPLFGPLDRDITLRHLSTRHFSDGLVQSEYAVLRPTY